jgi:hypothetical protein
LEKTISEPMFENRAIAVTKTSLKSAMSDVAYWRNQPYAARLAALETIRREFHQWKYHAEPGFQRVYTIIKRS